MNNTTRFPSEMWNFVTNNRLCTLATQSEKGLPHLSYLYYMIDGEKLYFVTDPSSKKAKNISLRGEVVILIATEVEPQSLECSANAKIVEDTALKINIFDKLSKVSNANESSLNWPPLFQLKPEHLIVIEMDITSFSYLNFGGLKSIYRGVPFDWTAQSFT
jgi:general stress protein 26